VQTQSFMPMQRREPEIKLQVHKIAWMQTVSYKIHHAKPRLTKTAGTRAEAES